MKPLLDTVRGCTVVVTKGRSYSELVLYRRRNDDDFFVKSG
jgi:hypothetical protein